MARRNRLLAEDKTADRWIISYADFITLLFAFFVVLYAISTVNQKKYQHVSQILADVFTDDIERAIPEGEQKSLTGVSSGELLSADFGAVENLDQNSISHAETIDRSIEEQFIVALDSAVINDDVRISKEKGWLKIELNSELLFDSGSAKIAAEADEVLDSISNILKGIEQPILIEGHTDDKPLKNNALASNWELSAVRAASVIRVFVWAGVNPKLLSAVGYGEYRPFYSNLTAAGRRKNRRVVIRIATQEIYSDELNLKRAAPVEFRAMQVNKINQSAQPIPIIEQTHTEQGGLLFKQPVR